MRKDMAKKLVDCHREGSAHSRRGGGGRHKGKVLNRDVIALRRERFDLDEDGELQEKTRAPKGAGMRMRSYDRKNFGENLAPLFRFLCKQVGRNWDTVYSEICEVLDRRGAVSGHIFDHLWDYVHQEKYVEIRDGKPYARDRFSRSGDGSLVTYTGNRYSSRFWVDPRDGKLKRGVKPPPSHMLWSQREKARKAAEPVRLIDLGKNKYLAQHEESGLWYRLEVREQEWRTLTRTRPVWDPIKGDSTKTVILREEVHKTSAYPDGLALPEKLSRGTWVVVVCQSASKKDLKQYVK